MVSAGVLVEGREIRLGTLTFIADDSAWLQEAPLDVDALPVRGATHFRACVRGVLLRQPSTQYRSAPPSSTLPVSRQRKRSGRSRLQRWVSHAVARQSATTQVAAIEPNESLYGLFDQSTGSGETASECGSSDPAAEILMVDGPHSPPGFARGGGAGDGGDPARGYEEYQPEPLDSLQREELRRRNVDALRTPIAGETPEARALEEARLANLAERTRLENLQRALDERARQRVPDTSRRQLFPPTQVYRTPIQNLAAATRIAESIQPSQSEAGRGLLQIRDLLRAAGDQNSAVSQSRNRIHSRSVTVNTVQSAHSPRSPPRREGRENRRDQYGDRLDRDDRRRVPNSPPRGGSYAPRQQDDRRQYSTGRRVPVDPREPGFDARSIIVQGLVDRNRAHRGALDRDVPTSSRVHVSGPECFSRAIRAAVIPPNFRLATGVSKFTGESKPETWLEDYRVAVQIGGGNDEVAMKHLPLMLEGSARAWLTQLPPSSIYTWEDLSRVFVRTFEGTCKRPAGLTELQVCVQKTNETLREYIQRWITLHHTVENVSDHQAVCAFKDGVKNRELSLKFGRTGDMTLSRMMEIATKYANGEEEDRLRSGKHKPSQSEKGNTSRKQKRKAEPAAPGEALAVTQGKFKGKPKGSWNPKKVKDKEGNDVMDMPCHIHTKKDEEGNIIYPKHTTRQCRLLIQQFQGKQSKDKEKESDKAEDKEDSEEGYPHINSTLMIFADVESRSRLKVINREVNMVAPAKANYLKWSQTPITFDQSDHPTHIATPGRQALVVDPVVEGTRLTKVLMDGGSGLNLLYADTLKGMGIPMSRLSTSNMSFHGVIPGKKAESLGQIALDVVFGDSKHFRKEKLTFEVVDFQSAYHAILGRPAYARFMARPCYVYLKLKMPGPKGVITVTGDRKKAEECFQKGSKIADSQVTAVEFEEYKQNADPSDLLRSKKPATESAFQSSGETKPVHIHPTDPDAAPTRISTTLDPK